jgi:hypothetical protein
LGLHRISRRGAVLIAGCALVLPVTAGTAIAALDLSASGDLQGQSSGQVSGEISPAGGSLEGSGRVGGERVSASGRGSEHGVSGKTGGPAGSGGSIKAGLYRVSGKAGGPAGSGGSIKAGPYGGHAQVCDPDGTCRGGGGSIPPSGAIQ